MSVNENSLLTWEGGFNQYPLQNIATDMGPYVFDPNDYIDISILSNDSSTIGIDLNTIEIVSYSHAGRSPYWNPNTQVLRIYLPDDGDPVEGIVQYRWKDKGGFYSNVANVYFNFEARATTWVVLPSSGHCEITSGGQNTGKFVYDTLIKRYNDNSADQLPLVTKANVSGDPDYIAPVNNFGLCPVSGTARAIILVHNNANPNFTYPSLLLISLVFKKTGFPDITYGLLLGNGSQQAISVPIQYYDSIELVYSTNPGGITATWSYVSYAPGNQFWQGTSNVSPIIISSGYLIAIQGGKITVSI